ncbi:MAG: ATP-dependent DNA helicase RecG [Eggerthellaceae bacterium]
MATLCLDQPVTAVPGISDNRARILGKLGIRTVRDLLTHFPRRYLDLSSVESISSASIGQQCTVAGTIYELTLKTPKPRLNLVEITLIDDTGTLIVTCFRQPWLMDKLSRGMYVAVSGEVQFNYGMKRMTNPFIEPVGEGGPRGKVVPIHGATEKLSAAAIRSLVQKALGLVRGVEDFLPLPLRQRYRLMSRGSALEAIHFPSSMAEQHEARRRLAYEEVLLLQLHLMRQRADELQGVSPVAHKVDGPALGSYYGALPFTLSDDQLQAVSELLNVMAEPSVASHMLLGDVGTGKTVVAGFGLCAAKDSGGQALMMAPTEVLARQYEAKLGPALDAAGVRCATLTGSTTAAERKEILEGLASGELDVVFGTHALLEPDVQVPRLTFVVIDEQQRFGVEQRRALAGKCPGADVLSMTATPIPRSLALTLFGQMTLSYISQRPLGTPPRKTVVCDRDQADVAYEGIRQALARGEQAYVVCPLVGLAQKDEGTQQKDQGATLVAGEHDEEHLEWGFVTIEDEGDFTGVSAKDAVSHGEFIAKVLPGAEVGALHGKLSSEEKLSVMDRFRSGEIDVLVCTTVIEVGVDVPNATVMVVEDADRFGLSQLHQLRGRVGRGDKPGSVYLLSGTRVPVAIKRLHAMETCDDGFELSEFDLSCRHEGDILGNRQSGASTLKMVNVARDKALIEAAHKDAAAILAKDPSLQGEGNKPLGFELARVFGGKGKERGAS